MLTSEGVSGGHPLLSGTKRCNFRLRSAQPIEPVAKEPGDPGPEAPSRPIAFDLLSIDGEDTRERPIEERRNRLKQLDRGWE